MNRYCVLVTRPKPKGLELCAYIEAHGGHAIYLPVIEFAKPTDLNALNESLAALSKQDFWIFISPQAVYATQDYLINRGGKHPPHLQYAAVGEGTAKALQEAGFPLSLYPKENWSSEGLLALPAFQSLTNKKIAVIRGEGGRDYLEKSLSSRGADVLPVMAYRRVLPEIKVDPYLNLINQHAIDVMVCTSFEGIQNLIKLLKVPDLYDIPLIVVSERIKILAQGLGFQTIWVARNASHEEIVNTILANVS